MTLENLNLFYHVHLIRFGLKINIEEYLKVDEKLQQQISENDKIDENLLIIFYIKSHNFFNIINITLSKLVDYYSLHFTYNKNPSIIRISHIYLGHLE